MANIEIEIDGRKLVAQSNQMLIQVADENGIYIPRFCYHKHLSVAANCRMCLVEVEKAPKPLPACATPVMPGMKVFTNSEKTIAAQRAVMEFLLINHPLDCPICDQGGECELQDLAMGYGSGHSNYNECKRSVADENLGPLIATDMTRCIYCTRCVRFGDEIAGMREMGATFRGEHTEIGTYVQHTVCSEVSGNIIDLCPVGALTSKPYRFTARPFELSQTPSIAPHDCIGTNINVHTRNGKVMRVVSRENIDINETWITDRDRFSYTALDHDNRVTQPMVKVEGKWRQVEWQHALEVAASGIHAVAVREGADKIGALASPSSTTEEFYLLSKLMRAIGSPHIDHRLRETDTRDQAEMGAYPGLGLSLDALEQCDAVVLIGSNLQKEQPLAALRLRKAVKNGAVICAINPVDFQFNFAIQQKIICAPQHMTDKLADVVKTIKQEANVAEAAAFAAALQGKQKVAVIVGALGMQHHAAAELRYLASQLTSALNGSLSLMTDGANAAGAWLAGAVANQNAGGLNAAAMLDAKLSAYILLNIDPNLDCANTQNAITAMKEAQFLVALSSFRNAEIEEYANVILPVAAFTETAGTYVNASGVWQSFTGMAAACGAARPAWKVLRVLGNFLHLEGFDYESSEQVRDELRAAALPQWKPYSFSMKPGISAKAELTRIGETPIYSVDVLTRHAEPLQKTQQSMYGEIDVVRLHPTTAARLQLSENSRARVKQGEAHVELPVVLDKRIAEGAAWVAAGRLATAKLGGLFAKIEIEKA